MSRANQPPDYEPAPTSREYAELVWLEGLFSKRVLKSPIPKAEDVESESQPEPEAESSEDPVQQDEGMDRQPDPEMDPETPLSRLSDPSQPLPQTLNEKGEEAEKKPLFFRNEPPLAKPLSHQRALHRLIPLRDKPWDRQINLEESIRKTAASRGLLQLDFHFPKERCGHLVIMVSDGVALAPWYPVIEAYRNLAMTCGAYRSITQEEIVIPAHGQSEFPKDSTGIRPGRDNLVLLIHDGLGDGMIRGTVGDYIRQQTGGMTRQVKVAWLHPWQESNWTRTSVSQLPIASFEATSENPLVIPVIPIERESNQEAGLHVLEGWFAGQKKSGIRSRRLPLSTEVSNPERGISRNRDKNEAEWAAQFDRLVDTCGNLTGKILCLAAVFVGGSSVEILTTVAKKLLPENHGMRQAIANAITSGFLKRASNQSEEKDVKKIALMFQSPQARIAVLSKIDPEECESIFQKCRVLAQSKEDNIEWEKYWQVDLITPGIEEEKLERLYLSEEELESIKDLVGVSKAKQSVDKQKDNKNADLDPIEAVRLKSLVYKSIEIYEKYRIEKKNLGKIDTKAIYKKLNLFPGLKTKDQEWLISFKGQEYFDLCLETERVYLRLHAKCVHRKLKELAVKIFGENFDLEAIAKDAFDQKSFFKDRSITYQFKDIHKAYIKLNKFIFEENELELKVPDKWLPAIKDLNIEQGEYRNHKEFSYVKKTGVTKWVYKKGKSAEQNIKLFFNFVRYLNPRKNDDSRLGSINDSETEAAIHLITLTLDQLNISRIIERCAYNGKQPYKARKRNRAEEYLKLLNLMFTNLINTTKPDLLFLQENVSDVWGAELSQEPPGSRLNEWLAGDQPIVLLKGSSIYSKEVGYVYKGKFDNDLSEKPNVINAMKRVIKLGGDFSFSEKTWASKKINEAYLSLCEIIRPLQLLTGNMHFSRKLLAEWLNESSWEVNNNKLDSFVHLIDDAVTRLSKGEVFESQIIQQLSDIGIWDLTQKGPWVNRVRKVGALILMVSFQEGKPISNDTLKELFNYRFLRDGAEKYIGDTNRNPNTTNDETNDPRLDWNMFDNNWNRGFTKIGNLSSPYRWLKLSDFSLRKRSQSKFFATISKWLKIWKDEADLQLLAMLSIRWQQKDVLSTYDNYQALKHFFRSGINYKNRKYEILGNHFSIFEVSSSVYQSSKDQVDLKPYYVARLYTHLLAQIYIANELKDDKYYQENFDNLPIRITRKINSSITEEESKNLYKALFLEIFKPKDKSHLNTLYSVALAELVLVHKYFKKSRSSTLRMLEDASSFVFSASNLLSETCERLLNVVMFPGNDWNNRISLHTELTHPEKTDNNRYTEVYKNEAAVLLVHLVKEFGFDLISDSTETEGLGNKVSILLRYIKCMQVGAESGDQLCSLMYAHLLLNWASDKKIIDSKLYGENSSPGNVFDEYLELKNWDSNLNGKSLIHSLLAGHESDPVGAVRHILDSSLNSGRSWFEKRCKYKYENQIKDLQDYIDNVEMSKLEDLNLNTKNDYKNSNSDTGKLLDLGEELVLAGGVARVEKYLGAGESGQVYQVKTSTGIQMAVKVFYPDHLRHFESTLTLLDQIIESQHLANGRIWPQEKFTHNGNGVQLTGYVMPLIERPDQYLSWYNL